MLTVLTEEGFRFFFGAMKMMNRCMYMLKKAVQNEKYGLIHLLI